MFVAAVSFAIATLLFARAQVPMLVFRDLTQSENIAQYFGPRKALSFALFGAMWSIPLGMGLVVVVELVLRLYRRFSPTIELKNRRVVRYSLLVLLFSAHNFANYLIRYRFERAVLLETPRATAGYPEMLFNVSAVSAGAASGILVGIFLFLAILLLRSVVSRTARPA